MSNSSKKQLGKFYVTGKELWAQTRRDMLAPVPSVTIDGWRIFNEYTNGFRPNEFSILCGSTGSGKTTWCANLSYKLIEQNIPHFVASVETGPMDFQRRLISAHVGKDWNTGDPVSLNDWKDFERDQSQMLRNSPLFLSLYENRFSVDLLMKHLDHVVSNYGVKIAVIDNLNFFMEVTSAQQSVIEMDRVIHELIIYCKRVPVHIIMIMHPKKTENGRVTSEFDIKGSSTAVQEAHNVFLFNRPSKAVLEHDGLYANENDRCLSVAKLRRRGKYTGMSILLKGIDGVRYEEKGEFRGFG